MKKVIGKVTEEEKNQIQALFERHNGLYELAKIVSADNETLYEKLVKDLGETNTKFQDWWSRMALHYHWERADGANWEIDFTTNEVYLVNESGEEVSC